MPVLKTEDLIFPPVLSLREARKGYCYIWYYSSILLFPGCCIPMEYNNISPEIHCYSGLSDRQSRIFRYIQKIFSTHWADSINGIYPYKRSSEEVLFLCRSSPSFSSSGTVLRRTPSFSRTLSPHHSMYIERNPEHIYLRIHTSSMRHKIPDFWPGILPFPVLSIFCFLHPFLRNLSSLNMRGRKIKFPFCCKFRWKILLHGIKRKIKTCNSLFL